MKLSGRNLLYNPKVDPNKRALGDEQRQSVSRRLAAAVGLAALQGHATRVCAGTPAFLWLRMERVPRPPTNSAALPHGIMGSGL